MALIKCDECSQEISNKASSCPNCGAPNVQEDDINQDNIDISNKTPIQESIKEEVVDTEKSRVNKDGFFKRYFTYNNEHITGASYFIRGFFALPLMMPFIFPGIYWIYIISYKRTKSLNWNNSICHIMSILNALLLPLAIGIPIHIIIWFGMFRVKK